MIIAMAASAQLFFGAPGTPGASEDALYLAELTENERAHFHVPVSNSAGLASAHQALLEVYEECSVANWDGHGALAVTQDTYRNAYFFIESIPHGFPIPAFGAEPDGHLTIEWHRDSYRTLSVSISPESEVHYAAMIGPARIYGTEAFWGEAPKPLLDLVRRIYA